MDCLCNEGCLLNNTQSPSIKCLLTISPGCNRPSNLFCMNLFFSKKVSPSLVLIELAPGYLNFPFKTRAFILSRLDSVTISGKVSSMAICKGTPTSSSQRFGFGEITVHPEYSTLFPQRFPLNRPCLPLILCKRPLHVFLRFLSWFDSLDSELISWL